MKSWACKCLLVGLMTGIVVAQDQPEQTGWETPADQQPYIPDQADQANQAPAAPAVEGPQQNGAVAAMLAIDPKYTEGIVVVTARDGAPQPRQWTVVARDTDDLGTLHKITVADGQVISDTISLNTYESLRQNVNIDPQQVQVDSAQAFFIAQPIAAANQKIIGHVDYALTVRGTDAAPLWTINCFDINGVYMGKVILLANTGAVLQTPGFRNAPTSN